MSQEIIRSQPTDRNSRPEKKEYCPSQGKIDPIFRERFTACFLILILGGIIYLNSWAGSFQWDDIPHIVRNPDIYNWNDIVRIFYFWPTRTFLFWTLALNYRLSGTDPFSYHLVNTMLHVFSSILVYLIFFRLRRKESVPSRSKDNSVSRLALLAGLLFVAHPIQTQAVSFIVQRGVGLSGFFCLAALYLYARWRQGGSCLNFVGSWLAGLLGIFSKEGAVVLPLLIGAWELFFGPEERWRKRLISWLPFVVFPLIMLATIWLIVRAGEGGFYYALNLQKQIPSVGLTDSSTKITSRWVYLITQFRVVLTYIRLIWLPVQQTIYYDFPLSISFYQTLPAISLLVILSIITIVCRLAVVMPVVSFGGIFFIISLIPTSSIIVLLPLVSEHHLYLGLAGFAWALPVALDRFFPRKQFTAIGGLIILLLAFLSIHRNLVWLNPFSLWSDALKKAPRLASLHDSMASVYIESGRYAEALVECQKALELDPNYNAFHNLWAAYHNLGNYYLAEQTARKYLQRFPGRSQPHQALALTMIAHGDYAGAEQELLAAISLQPEDGRPHLLLGGIYQKNDDKQRAEEEFKEAIRLAPYMIAGYEKLGMMLENEKREDEAIAIYREALKINPNYLSCQLRLNRLRHKFEEENGK